jgi:hypothetical protein
MITSTEIRAWARENDVAVGTRGRLGPVVKGAFFAAHPAIARETAREAGIEVSQKGRIKDETLALIVNVLP